MEGIYRARPFKTRNADEYDLSHILNLFVSPTEGLATPFDYDNTIVKGRMGSGKTMFLRHLVSSSERLSVFLPAARCTEGIIAAIRVMLEGPARDPGFLETLVYSGALDIYVDGLNEVSPDTRARIAQDAEKSANIILATQPLEWEPPAKSRVMVLEPLNWFANHGGTFLQGSPQAYALCKAVDSPSCKILFDIYHQQITEGNLLPNIERCWDEIGYFQCGDNPGRKEPGTGEINYRNVFRYIHSRGFDGVLGMEHGNSKKGAEGEQAVIDAYADADSFTPVASR